MNPYPSATKNQRTAPNDAYTFLEFNLPHRPSPDVIDIADDSDDNLSTADHTNNTTEKPDITNNDDDDGEILAWNTDTRIGSLPPSFSWLPMKTRETASTTPLKKIPMTQVKLEAATHSMDDRQVIHVYLQVTIDIKPDAPDWPGLMKVFDFLHFRVGPNASILVLPSRRKGGDENPILTRWTKATNRSIYSVYFQGYNLPKTPTSTAADKKKTTKTKNNATLHGDNANSEATKGHTLHLRTCVSLHKFQLTTLATAVTTLQDQYLRLSIDPIRAEFVDKIGWLTGTHKFMNIAHWRHFIHTQLLELVGSTYDFRLQMDSLTPPRSVSGNERYRQTHTRNGVDPIQMWGIYAARQSFAGFSSTLHSLFHSKWKGKVFGQDMQFLPVSIGDTPDGLATIWTAAKTWQESTYVVKSFGLRHIHDLVHPQDPDTDEDTKIEPHSLAYYCRQIHPPGGPPLFRAVEERDPTPSDILLHGPGPVAYFLIHKDNLRVAEQFAADVYNALAYTVHFLKPEHVYLQGSNYVPIAATKATVEAEAAEALAALNLRINGTPATKAPPSNPDSAASTKTTASNPLDTPATSPQRNTKKPRMVGSSNISDQLPSPRDTTTATSSLTASEHQRIRELEEQVQDLLESHSTHSDLRLLALEAQVQRMEDLYRGHTQATMGDTLKRIMMEMFPSQAHFTSALFQDYDMSDVPPHSKATENTLPPLSPPYHTPPGTSHEMMDTDNNSQDEYHTAKQAEMEGDG
jgi:hypothetical protein